MSPLALIKRSMQRKQRLNDAQLLMAKAYRGVPYTKISKGFDHAESAKQYRGIEYVS
jgi:hypothetical protein